MKILFMGLLLTTASLASSFSARAEEARFLGCAVTRNSFFHGSKGQEIISHDTLKVTMTEAKNGQEQRYVGSIVLPTPVAGSPEVKLVIDASYSAKMPTHFTYYATVSSAKNGASEILMAGSVAGPIHQEKDAVTNLVLTMQNPFVLTLRANNPDTKNIFEAKGFPLDTVVYDSVELRCRVQKSD